MAKKTRAADVSEPVETEFIPCIPKLLPDDVMVVSAITAVNENPANAVPILRAQQLIAEITTALSVDGPTYAEDVVIEPGHLALLTSRYWGQGGVKLSVAFFESTATDLRDRILSHFNAWGQYANVVFSWSSSLGSADVRVTRSGDGYWSYTGTDIRHISANQPTMCLQRFTMDTPESEYKRVVRHEVGHTLGMVHEQQLPEIVELLDVQKTIAWGRQALGWNEQMVRSQILTPINPATVTMTPHADIRGIMAYRLPASITKNGQEIPGGTDIDDIDGAFVGKLYPRAVQPPPPPPPPPPMGARTIVVTGGSITIDGVAA